MKIAHIVVVIILSCVFCGAIAQERRSNIFAAIKSASNEDLCTLMGMLFVAKEPRTKPIFDFTSSELSLRSERCLPKEKYIALGQKRLTELRARNAKQNTPSTGTKILNFLGVLANAYVQGRYGRYSNRDSIQSVPLSCTSDFDCGVSKSCLKRPYTGSGICVTPVDKYGLPTLKLPDLDNIGPRTAEGCLSSAECPAGFRCDTEYKACLRL